MYGMTARYSSLDEREVTQAIEQALTDPAAFKPIYEEYFPRVYRYCLRRVGRPQEAEDLTSVTFTRALVGLASYRGGSSTNNQSNCQASRVSDLCARLCAARTRTA